jgi:hypothetical protein
MKERAPFFGLLRRRECLMPTLRGWLVFFLLAAGVFEIVLHEAYPFLAPNDSLPGGILVAEGWMDDHTSEDVTAEFKRGHYQALLVTGGPIDKGSMFSEFETIAQLTEAVFVKNGFDPKLVHAVPSRSVQRDRTYASAVSVKNWLRDHGMTVTKINLMSLGAHARRSRLLYQKAFGDSAKVGVIALPEGGFDTKHWWVSSEGFRSVTGEMIAYAYARLLFTPSAE